MQLLLVRHPRPAVAPELCYGASDVAVAETELARVHANLRAAGLPGQLPVFSSPLQRCANLARRLQPVSLNLDARLAEMDFGRWEMQAWDHVPRDEVDAWAADLLHYRPGGAECVLDVAGRVAAFLDDLRRTGHAQTLLVCHAGTIRLLRAMHGGAALEQAALDAARTPHRIAYGEPLLLDV